MLSFELLCLNLLYCYNDYYNQYICDLSQEVSNREEIFNFGED